MQDTKTWRTLARVIEVGFTSVTFCFPGIDSRKDFILKKEVMPVEVYGKLIPGYRLYAKVNLNAEDESELNISDWEIPSHQ